MASLTLSRAHILPNNNVVFRKTTWRPLSTYYNKHQPPWALDFLPGGVSEGPALKAAGPEPKAARAPSRPPIYEETAGAMDTQEPNPPKKQNTDGRGCSQKPENLLSQEPKRRRCRTSPAGVFLISRGFGEPRRLRHGHLPRFLI